MKVNPGLMLLSRVHRGTLIKHKSPFNIQRLA